MSYRDQQNTNIQINMWANIIWAQSHLQHEYEQFSNYEKKEKKNYEKRNSKTDASANDSFRETFNATWTIRFDHREIYDHLYQALNNSLSEKILVVF